MSSRRSGQRPRVCRLTLPYSLAFLSLGCVHAVDVVFSFFFIYFRDVREVQYVVVSLLAASMLRPCA
jgi:hypothetical protein